MRHLTRCVCLLLALCCCFLLGGCSYLLPKEEAALAPPLVEPAAITYKTAVVERGDISKTATHNARFLSSETADLYVDYAGAVVDEILVTYGSAVKAGDVLVRFNSGDLHWEMERAEIAYQQATLVWERAQRNEYGFNLQMAELNYQLACSQYEQMKQRYDRAQIVSPIDGQVTYITSLKPGQAVETYACVARVADPKSVLLCFEETANIAQYRAGMDVQVEFDKQTYTGTILSAPYDRPEEVGDYERNAVVIEVEQKLAMQVSMGMDARVEVPLQQSKDTLLVPGAAVHSFQNRNYVFVLSEEGIKEERDVTVGIRGGSQTEILSGLQAGELVIVG